MTTKTPTRRPYRVKVKTTAETTKTTRAFQLIEGDCIEVMRRIFEAPDEPRYMKGNHAKLVLGSPPYALKGERYYRWKTDKPELVPHKMDSHAWIEWMLDVIEASLDLAPVAAFVVNDTYRDGQHHPAVDGLIWKAYEAGIFGERPLIWHKNAPPNRADWFGNDWERIIVFKRKSGPVPTWNPKAIGTPPKFKTGGDFRQRDSKGQRRKGGSYPKNATTRPRDVIRACVGGGLMGHPLAHKNEAPFPESLIEPLILSLTNPGDTILDPFCGSGSTLAVAIKHGRKAIGIEARKSQLVITRERLKSL